MVDLSKYPIEKLFHFAAGVIPGGVVLLVLEVVSPGKFSWFFSLPFLGYRTKLGLILLAAFVIGNSMTAFLTALLGGIGGAIGAATPMRPNKLPFINVVAPWHDLRWRALVKNRLKADAPKDTFPMSKDIYDIRLKMIEFKPEPERAGAILELNNELFAGNVEDGKWEQWYDHFHRIILQRTSSDAEQYVRTGLNFNLEAASLFLLFCVIAVPRIRHWWCILPASLWVLMLCLETYWGIVRSSNKWFTLGDQLKYLSETEADAAGTTLS